MQVLGQKHWPAALLLTGFALALCLPAQAESASLQLEEQKIKAGLIYNFIKYTDWPAAKLPESTPVAVCVFGTSPLAGYLHPMEGRTVQQRNITVREIDDAAEADDCHLLFIGAEEGGRWPDIRSALADKSILTIGDFPGFSGSGGMIQFSNEENRIQLRLNMQALSKAHLNVSDKLRRLASTTR